MILCCGDTLIDMLPRRSEDGEPAFVPHTGGAIFNTSVALGRLGIPVALFTGVSTDLFGAQVLADLKTSRVETGYLRRSNRHLTLAFVHLDNGEAEYLFYDENSAGRMLSVADLPDLSEEITALFFGGISLIPEPCGSTHEKLATREAGRRVVMLDPNIRPRFISDEATYRARIDRMLALADIIKLSEEDLHWLFGPGDVTTLATAVLAHGPKVVLITLGAAGTAAMTERVTTRVAAVPVEVCDTVGAGDTFNAGVLAALCDRGVLDKARLASLSAADLDAALSLGVHAAAVTVSRPGANPPWRREIGDLHK